MLPFLKAPADAPLMTDKTALGGTLHISCLHGTRVSVSLPQRYV